MICILQACWIYLFFKYKERNRSSLELVMYLVLLPHYRVGLLVTIGWIQGFWMNFDTCLDPGWSLYNDCFTTTISSENQGFALFTWATPLILWFNNTFFVLQCFGHCNVCIVQGGVPFSKDHRWYYWGLKYWGRSFVIMVIHFTHQCHTYDRTMTLTEI